MESSLINEANIEREKQRSESEARDIIHDIDRLYTFPEEMKSRWIWELLQNAKDVATKDGIDIHIVLTNEKLEFKHNGLPFKTKHLLAILYKTSTKSLSGEGGTTGKYGTGFVTTHILNKKLTISGVHQNDDGNRRFEMVIDRSQASLEENKALSAMQDSLLLSFNAISEIAKKSSEPIDNNWNAFSYSLKPETFIYAQKGLYELEKNLTFTLLINPKLKSITIESPSGKKEYTSKSEETSLQDIGFISTGTEIGLLYQKTGKLILGIPSKKNDAIYELLPITNQAILYKEFPLIGTEGFNLPVLIQHEDFHPTEQRGGIRSKINSEGEIDPIADKNRNALIEFTETYISFISKIVDTKWQGAHLLAKSGLPDFVDTYSNREWFEEKIQNPIRNTILKKEIVTTYSSKQKKIADSKFIIKTSEYDESFYKLASALIPEQIPDNNSVWQWSETISQEFNKWPNDIIIQIEDLVKLIPQTLNLDDPTSFNWLKKFYQFLEANNLSYLGETNPIFPNEAGRFCLRDEVSIHPIIDDEFKVISKGLGRTLEDEFLNKELGNIPAIKTFDLLEFYKHLNNDLIGELKIESASNEQIRSIFHICSLFRSDRSTKREQWLKIINQLLPDIIQPKKIVSVDYDNYGRSAEFWSIKYICHLIETAQKPTVFALKYFDNNIDTCFQWLNDFLSFTFDLQEESKELILRKIIIPTQSDEFRCYDDFIFAEQNSQHFDDIIKDIYKKYTKKGDPRNFIIDKRILVDGIRQKEVDILTNEIDKIFTDENIESKVKRGGNLNDMFLQLNNWFENFSTSSAFLPTFSSKRTLLYVLALGEGFSRQIMEIRNTGKSIEDLTELAKISLTTEEMKMFESMAQELGTKELLSKAQEMLKAKYQIERWKMIGKAAENAFREALEYTEPSFEILNPDLGRDFVIIANNKQYSIEIKSVEPLKGNVNMSLLQGSESVKEKDSYALCVMTRPEDDRPVDKDYFMQESRFVPDIGYKIGSSIEQWNEGLRNLDTKTDVKVTLDDKTESIYIGRDTWKYGISFDKLIDILKTHFNS